ncbi:hypothetical protein PHMEG_00021050 [Phytophthora megakarya]|uniref:Uncharacterized protein n=1 Tax=Phytophthora megakarya TaxID=4795 RepID=A0A225VQ61_9STRA|nr:hypothetical protein PHMEG_00021050 [Phytophthora megakarya]
MGSLEKAYHRLLHPLPYDKEKRKLRLDNLFRLANYRVRTEQVSQIRKTWIVDTTLCLSLLLLHVGKYKHRLLMALASLDSFKFQSLFELPATLFAFLSQTLLSCSLYSSQFLSFFSCKNKILMSVSPCIFSLLSS